MDERWLPTVMIWALALTGLWLNRRRVLLHPILIATFVTAAIGTFLPVMSLLVEPRTWHNIGLPSGATFAAVEFEYLAFLGGLLLTFCLLTRRRPREVPPPRVEHASYLAHRDLLVASGLVLSGLPLYAAYIASVGLGPLLDADDLAAKHLASVGLGPLQFGSQFMAVGCFWAEGSELSARRKLPFRIVALALAGWSVLFLSSRGTTAMIGVAYLFLFCTRRRFPLRRLRPSIVILVVLSYAGLEAFASSRGASEAGFIESLGSLALTDAADMGLATMVGGSELSHPFYASLELMQNELPGDLGGESYLTALFVLVPLFINPERQSTLAQMFAAEHYPELADRGGGAAFSLVGEAWWNFGSVGGPLLVGALLGVLFAGWDTCLSRRPWGLVARITPYFLYLVAMAHRFESAGLLKQTVFLAGPVLVLVVFAHCVWRAAGRESGHALRTLAPPIAFPRPGRTA